jgi:hypothetical protein
MSWVYKIEDATKVGSRCRWYEVGFYEPDGDFIQVSTMAFQNEAADYVHYLNGGSVPHDESYLHTSKHDRKGKQHD